MDIKTERLQQEESKEASTILALAFQESPNVKAIFQDPSSEKALKSFSQATQIAKLERKMNFVLVAKSNNKIIGVLNMVKAPHCQFTLLEQLKLAPRLVYTYGKSLPKAMKLVSEWSKKDPPNPHWHIGPIGVLPEYQGNGIGSRLLEESLQIIDEKGIDAYLETDSLNNVHLYERFGFNTIDTVIIMGNTNWLMLRKA